MTEPNAKPATVYAYLDLAESDVPYSYIRVPLSDGRAHQFLDHAVEVSRWMGDLDEYPTRSHGFTLVRGARALEFAEREVREAARPNMREVDGPLASVHREDHILALTFANGCTTRWSAPLHEALARAVDLRDRLRAKLAETGTKFARKEDPRFGFVYKTVDAARERGVCRLCGLKPEYRLPFVYDYGREYAHERCLKRESYLHPLVASDPSQYIDKEDKPMPEKPKPDPHAECRLSLRDGVLVDDYGRALNGVTHLDGERWLDRMNQLTWYGVKASIRLSEIPLDPAASRPAPAPPEPIVLKLDREIPSAEIESILADFQRVHGRPVIVLPHYIRRVSKPEEDEVRADISRRADIAATARKSLCIGALFGLVAGFALACAAFFAVARLKPEWLAPKPSPAVLDEHAQETEDARARAEGNGEEGR